MAAWRPPWISKNDFYSKPFDYCDQWCRNCELNKICPQSKKEKRVHNFPVSKKYPVYSLAVRFSEELGNLVKELVLMPDQSDEELFLENIEILLYYRFLVPSAIYRAYYLASKKEDSRVVAFIAMNSAISATSALLNLAEHDPLNFLARKMVRLGKVSLNLAKVLYLEFELVPLALKQDNM